MSNRLQELADTLGLGALPADVTAITPSPHDDKDRLARPDLPELAADDTDGAIHRRTRRGPEPRSTAVIRRHLAERARELALFEQDTASRSLPRTAMADGGHIGSIEALAAAPPQDLDTDPEVWFERLAKFDLDAAWQLAQLESGREVLRGDAGAAMLGFADTLERAHCPRWALAQLLVLQHVGHPEAAPRVTEILLEDHAWEAAIDFVATTGDAALEAYVAARAPAAPLAARNKQAWSEHLGRSQGLVDRELTALSRAETAWLLGLAERGLDEGVALIDVPRLKTIIARFPTWRHAQRVMAKLLFSMTKEAQLVPLVIDRYLASFGPDERLFASLRSRVSPEVHRTICERLVREVESFPHWVAPWRSLARFALSDLNAAMRLVRALGG